MKIQTNNIKSKQDTNIVHIEGYDDILLICSNVEQVLKHLIKEFKTLNKQEKAEVIVMFDNTYVGQILRELNAISNSGKKKS